MVPPSPVSAVSHVLQMEDILRFKLAIENNYSKDLNNSLLINIQDSEFNKAYSNRGSKLEHAEETVDFTRLNSNDDEFKLVKIKSRPLLTTIDNNTTTTAPAENLIDERLVLINKKSTIDSIIKKELDEEFGNPDEDSDYEMDDNYNEDAAELLQNLDVANILKPIVTPSDIVRRKTFVDIYKSKHLTKLAEETIHIIEKEQDNVNQLSKLMDVFLGDDFNNYRSNGLALPLYDHNLDLDAKLKKEAILSNGNTTVIANETTTEMSGMDLDSTQDEVQHTDLGHTGGIVDPEVQEANKAIKDPFFKLPQFKRDFNFGVQKVEDAEESRQLIQIALQRNEEFIRSLTTIRNGFIRAERLKDNIFRWCKEIDDMEHGSTNGNGKAN